MTLSEYLRGLTNYPVSEEALQSILSKRGLDGKSTTTDDKLLCLTTADVYRWLSTAPDISQGGQSYSLTDNIREFYRKRANELYREAGEPERVLEEHPRYGYKGERL
ncbi:hypothetical protein [Porphyromonas endodontalis]|uniref:hypothetical protein n=1 Tax=Porphyromonas endodontalis TaxID=28124 RepID=UPI003C7E86FC